MSALADLMKELLEEKIQAAQKWLDQNLTQKQQDKLAGIIFDLVAGEKEKEEKVKEPSKKLDPDLGSVEEIEQNG